MFRLMACCIHVCLRISALNKKNARCSTVYFILFQANLENKLTRTLFLAIIREALIYSWGKSRWLIKYDDRNAALISQR